jgi:Ca2+-binding EF-hand superfamily protein
MATELQIEKLDRAFDHVDADHSGQIDRDDLLGLGSRLLLSFGQAPTSRPGRLLLDRFDELWTEVAAYADVDGSEAISPAEFRTAMISAYVEQQIFDQTFRPAAAALAAVVDTDGDGSVGLEEFQVFQSAFGTTDDDATAAFDLLDRDHNGSISVDELIVAAHQYYTSADPQAPGNSLYGPL